MFVDDFYENLQIKFLVLKFVKFYIYLYDLNFYMYNSCNKKLPLSIYKKHFKTVRIELSLCVFKETFDCFE